MITRKIPLKRKHCDRHSGTSDVALTAWRVAIAATTTSAALKGNANKVVCGQQQQQQQHASKTLPALCQGACLMPHAPSPFRVLNCCCCCEFSVPVAGVSFSWEKASKNAAPSGSITRGKGACQPVSPSVSQSSSLCGFPASQSGSRSVSARRPFVNFNYHLSAAKANR